MQLLRHSRDMANARILYPNSVSFSIRRIILYFHIKPKNASQTDTVVHIFSNVHFPCYLWSSVSIVDFSLSQSEILLCKTMEMFCILKLFRSCVVYIACDRHKYYIQKLYNKLHRAMGHGLDYIHFCVTYSVSLNMLALVYNTYIWYVGMCTTNPNFILTKFSTKL